MLTKSEILKQLNAGRIVIDPFEPSQLGPNSYDVRLGETLIKPAFGVILDPRQPQADNIKKEVLGVNDAGEPCWTLYPGQLYLACTVESTVSKYYIPSLHGKSSLARLGIAIHLTAGFGDLGWGFVDGGSTCTRPSWTLEVTVAKPVYLYPGMRIGQVAFHKPEGAIEHLYEGKYNRQHQPQPSLSYKDYQ